MQNSDEVLDDSDVEQGLLYYWKMLCLTVAFFCHFLYLQMNRRKVVMMRGYDMIIRVNIKSQMQQPPLGCKTLILTSGSLAMSNRL